MTRKEPAWRVWLPWLLLALGITALLYLVPRWYQEHKEHQEYLNVIRGKDWKR
jgi:hypothetical protein